MAIRITRSPRSMASTRVPSRTTASPATNRWSARTVSSAAMVPPVRSCKTAASSVTRSDGNRRRASAGSTRSTFAPAASTALAYAGERRAVGAEEHDVARVHERSRRRRARDAATPPRGRGASAARRAPSCTCCASCERLPCELPRSWPIRNRSSTATGRQPRRRRCHAVARPTTPPPMTTARYAGRAHVVAPGISRGMRPWSSSSVRVPRP